MYVAVLRDGRSVRYELRRSVPMDGGFGFEMLADLGDDPGRLVHFGRFGISYAEELLERLAVLDLDMDALDAAFAPFAPQGFRDRADRGGRWARTVLTRTQEDAIRSLHPFDRRRMAYLRSGEVNLSRIDEVSSKLFLRLLGKSRDEIEQLFLRMERSLSLDEARHYVHAAFNLQRHFAKLTARTMPEALDPAQMDEAFMHEFCLLYDDALFAFGLPRGVHAYLRRYACMHYDFEFAAAGGFERIFQDFMNDFRRHRPRPKPVAPERVRDLFGMTMSEIRSMTRREFARVFRKKAMSMHPDKGGDHDAFVELLDTYKRIVSSKPE
ncbi:MAG: hypothetical protein KUA37_16360 [Desulfomicrobium sp.]|nr:hypothetical protein [Pseudomonadota bacterium]MBV1713557.1 hypothetical protein [Desulfomicrobium sp.]MBU4572093.1 hypothetical protein [Pseudomonadota bacterium]MBU4594071.1 hypothetical protein [Pseudomonadota bacterium]MBV1720978.1 hypothetical protein [Desulfomicrobium sp.]